MSEQHVDDTTAFENEKSMTGRPDTALTHDRRIDENSREYGGRAAVSIARTSLLAAVALAGLLLTPVAAFAQDAGENDGQRAVLYRTEIGNESGRYVAKLFGDRAVCIAGLTFDVEVRFWPLLGEPVVLSHASYDFFESGVSLAFYRDVGAVDAFSCEGNAEPFARVEPNAGGWRIVDELDDYVSFEMPRGAVRDLVSVYGMEFVLDASPEVGTALAFNGAVYVENFSGVFTDGGRSSFNVAGSPNWNRLFHRGATTVNEAGKLGGWTPLSPQAARTRLAGLLQECPASDPCHVRLEVQPVIKASVNGLVHELTQRSDTFRDLYYDSPKEALVEELMAGVARERPGSSRHARRTQLVDKALDGFANDINPDLSETWAETRDYESRRHDAHELDRLDERLTDAIADEGEADDDLRAEVRRAADGVQSDWGQGRAELLLEWAAHEEAVVEPVVEKVSTGFSHTCGVTPQGSAYCWGEGLFGVLGHGSESDADRPAQVAGGHIFAQISVGDDHTCAITSEGAPYCWGSNSYGKLGSGGPTSGDVRRTPRPVRVVGGHTFAQISAGDDHTCAITPEGVAYCWGRNYGRLGNGSTSNESRPVRVAGGHTFAQISIGDEHTCGITPEGAAYCWGSGVWGRVGNGSDDDADRPVRVAGGHTFAQISAGRNHTCGITPEGVAYCWGDGTNGLLGSGGPTSGESHPVRVAGGHTFTQISAGDEHTCAITPEGTAYCWGVGRYGQLGSGSTPSEDRPVRVAGGHTFTQISAGNDYTCATTPEGSAYCWGGGGSGQLGNGSTGVAEEPVRVDAPF